MFQTTNQPGWTEPCPCFLCINRRGGCPQNCVHQHFKWCSNCSACSNHMTPPQNRDYCSIWVRVAQTSPDPADCVVFFWREGPAQWACHLKHQNSKGLPTNPMCFLLATSIFYWPHMFGILGSNHQPAFYGCTKLGLSWGSPGAVTKGPWGDT